LTITLTVAWALFALAPGLAVFAGLFLSQGRDVVHPSAPAPASLIALAIVVFGALGLHTAAAMALAINDITAASLTAPWVVPFDPNVYRYFLGARDARLMGSEAALLLGLLLLLSALGFWTTRRFARASKPGSTFHAFLYGWVSPILEQLEQEEGYLKHMIAWVVTDLEAGDLAVGYEGQVEMLSLNSDKQIAWLTLRNCETFVIAPDQDVARRKPVPREMAIPRLQLEGPHVRNVAFAVVLVAVDAIPSSATETVDSTNT